MGEETAVIAPDQMSRLVELANDLVWKDCDLSLLRHRPIPEYPLISQALQSQLTQSNARGKLLLPNLRAFGNTSVAVFSDYSGEGAGHYDVYSALICSYGLTAPFSQHMRSVRSAHDLHDKEIEFKDFRIGKLRAVLPEYLSALDGVPGFLCTLAVDKKLKSLFGPEDATPKQLSEMLRAGNLGDWKPGAAEKLLRVVHLVAFLAALLTHDGQRILWMTDHDAISPNKEMHNFALSLFERVLQIYVRPGNTFPVIGGAVPFAERSLEMLDLLSVPDVAAGSIAQYLTERDSTRHENVKVKRGADDVLRWLAHDGIGLKKATFILRRG
ncbi:MAG: hypothetical protein ABSA78_20715 [Candidatus Sulfotelmatobacter sp.]|jgi:hypothetical protein